MPELRERFEAAEVRAPLSQHQQAELEAVLARAGTVEDLPGKWQAALLAAEAGTAPASGCCGNH
jgi:hypothetical protein